ncbi:endonuclease/exonuclease/phosphatase family protein [Kitasatospora sp. NPDC006786]|uniref:endonuclease/exonuclease/phosphatase family protein n=1 Tax=unclassified Kitasatospora TaxID=2633591 RepID=UPI0033C8E9DF
MELLVVVQNLGQGGLRDGSGAPEDRWPLLAERILTAGGPAAPPDLVLLQEAVDWGRYGHRQLALAMRDLDMDALPLPPSGSGYPTALLYRRETVGRWLNWNVDFAHRTLHGFGVATFDVGLPAPLAVASVHLDPFSPDSARAEAKLAATRALRYGPYGMVCGDINYPPASPDSPEPDYAAMRPYNRSARTLLPSQARTALPSQAGALLTEVGPAAAVPDRRVAETLAHTGYVDAAWHLYQQNRDPELLRRTSTDDRIDQAWVSAPLAPAVTGYRVLDAPAGASDHHGLAVHLDLARAATDDVWEYR